MKIKHKILLFTLVVFLVILLVSSSVMIGVIFQMRNNNAKLEREIDALENEVEEFEKILEEETSEDVVDENESEDNNSEDKKLIFEDESQDIKIEYPSSWTVSTDIKIGNSLVLDAEKNEEGLVLTNYKIIFEKNGSRLEVSKHYTSGFGGFSGGLSKDEYDYKVISEDFVRERLKSESDWNYTTKADCEDVSEDLRNGADVCIGLFFPFFGKEFGNTKYPASVRLINADSEEIIKEADEIALSILK